MELLSSCSRARETVSSKQLFSGFLRRPSTSRRSPCSAQGPLDIHSKNPVLQSKNEPLEANDVFAIPRLELS